MARKEKVTVELSTQDRNLLKDIRDALLALNPDNDEARKANTDEGASRRLVEIIPRTVTLFVDDEQVSQAVVNEYAIKEQVDEGAKTTRALIEISPEQGAELFKALGRVIHKKEDLLDGVPLPAWTGGVN